MPTFVFPVKRRGFDDAFFQSCLMLETLSIPDQETIVGLFRVNLTKIEGKFSRQMKLGTVCPIPGTYQVLSDVHITSYFST